MKELKSWRGHTSRGSVADTEGPLKEIFFTEESATGQTAKKRFFYFSEIAKLGKWAFLATEGHPTPARVKRERNMRKAPIPTTYLTKEELEFIQSLKFVETPNQPNAKGGPMTPAELEGWLTSKSLQPPKQ
jgi:hypothetical protein